MREREDGEGEGGGTGRGQGCGRGWRMPSENWPLEKIGTVCAASFLCFGLLRLLLEKLIVPAIWPKFKTLDARVQKDFCVRCTSVVVRRPPPLCAPLLCRAALCLIIGCVGGAPGAALVD